MSIDDILNFLKGFVPGYAALENLVAPPFGSDVDDYGQCRCNCTGGAETWPVVILECNKCVEKIQMEAVIKILPELAGSVAGGGLGFSAFKDALGKALENWLEKKGLTSASRAVPVIGWIFIIGDIANFISTLLMIKKILDAGAAAKKKFCICP